MNKQDSKPSSMAGGIFIAIGMLAGAIVGVLIDQPSAGMVGGFGLGVAAAVVLWLVDSKRS
jgi:formate/nitrite transporter FocA (FNT family)